MLPVWSWALNRDSSSLPFPHTPSRNAGHSHAKDANALLQQLPPPPRGTQGSMEDAAVVPQPLDLLSQLHLHGSSSAQPQQWLKPPLRQLHWPEQLEERGGQWWLLAVGLHGFTITRRETNIKPHAGKEQSRSCLPLRHCHRVTDHFCL